MDQPVNEYPQRLNLHREVHARPPIALWPEERVCSQTFLIQDPQQRQIQSDWVENVLRAHARSDCLVDSASYKLIQVEDDPHRLLLRWELHGEFSTLTVFHQNAVSLKHDDWSESRTDVLSMLRSKLFALGYPLPHEGFKIVLPHSILLFERARLSAMRPFYRHCSPTTPSLVQPFSAPNRRRSGPIFNSTQLAL